MSWSECCGCAMAFYAASQRHMMVQYCCGSGSTNKIFCNVFMLYICNGLCNRRSMRLLCDRMAYMKVICTFASPSLSLHLVPR